MPTMTMTGREPIPPDPKLAIPPTPIVTRRGSRRWHLADGDRQGRRQPVMCGQTPVVLWYSYQQMTAYNAEQVACTDCVVAAIGRKVSERGGAK